MLPKHKLKVAMLLAVSVIIYWKSYVIVIGQTAAPVLVALNKQDATLAIIDPKTMEIRGKVATGDSPHEVVIMPDGKTAVVANYGAQTPGSSFSIIDLESKKETKRVDLSPLMRPHGLIELGGKVYFTAETNRLIGRYDLATNRVDWLMGTGQNATHMIVGTPDQKHFYTANIASDSVTAFEFQNVPPSASKVAHIAVGKQPEAIDVSSDGRQVWVGLNADGAIDVIETATNRVVDRIKLGGRPYRVRFAPDGKIAAATIPDAKEIVLFDAVARKETKRFKLESVPLGIVFSKDGGTAFVTVVEPDLVLKIDISNGEITGSIKSGAVPDGVALFGN